MDRRVIPPGWELRGQCDYLACGSREELWRERCLSPALRDTGDLTCGTMGQWANGLRSGLKSSGAGASSPWRLCVCGFGTDMEGPALHTQNPAMPRCLLQAAPTYPPIPDASCLGHLLEWASHPISSFISTYSSCFKLPFLGNDRQPPINTPSKVPVTFPHSL